MITVSIVTYKTDTEELRKCLESLCSSEVKRIYVVDNSKYQYLADFCSGLKNVEYIPNINHLNAMKEMSLEEIEIN